MRFSTDPLGVMDVHSLAAATGEGAVMKGKAADSRIAIKVSESKRFNPGITSSGTGLINPPVGYSYEDS
jgi:hypothetical protein